MVNTSRGDLKPGNQLCFSLYRTSLAISKPFKPLLEELRLIPAGRNLYPQPLIGPYSTFRTADKRWFSGS